MHANKILILLYW